jgi:hypothetical protein
MKSISKPEHAGAVDDEHSRYSSFMRRSAAANYLKGRYGHGSEKTLAKLACLGGGLSSTRPAGGWCSIHEKPSILGHSHGLAALSSRPPKRRWLEEWSTKMR